MADYKIEDTYQDKKGAYKLKNAKLGRDVDTAEKMIKIMNYLKVDPSVKQYKLIPNILYQICIKLGMK